MTWEIVYYVGPVLPAALWMLQAAPSNDPVSALFNLGGIGALSGALLWFYRQDRKASQDRLAELAKDNATSAAKMVEVLEKNSAQLAQVCEILRELSAKFSARDREHHGGQ